MLKLLVFDLDGTLVETRKDLWRSINFSLKQHGLSELPLEAVAASVGDGARTLVERVLALSLKVASEKVENRTEKPPVDFPAVDSILEVFLNHYADHCLEDSRPYPGVEEALAGLKDYRKAVLTNKPSVPTRKILAGLGWEGRFDIVLGGDTPLGKKPDPAGLRHLMVTLGAGPESTLMIGDGIQDLRVARRAGAHFLGFLGGIGDRAALLAEGPDSTLEDMHDLAEALGRIGKQLATEPGTASSANAGAA